jgi:hypothetical protein
MDSIHMEVVLVLYNLPPEMAIKAQNLMLSMIIPGMLSLPSVFLSKSFNLLMRFGLLPLHVPLCCSRRWDSVRST